MVRRGSDLRRIDRSGVGPGLPDTIVYIADVDYRRNFQPGGTFFFTVVAYQRQPIFKNAQAFELLQTVVDEVKAQWPFTMQAWVVLADYLHMIWTLPPSDSDFSARWSKIKSRFTRRWLARGGYEADVTPGKRRDQRRGVWQPKFFEHTIRDENDMIAQCRIHPSQPRQARLRGLAQAVGPLQLSRTCPTRQLSIGLVLRRQ